MKQERIHWKKPFFTIVLGQTVSLVGSSAVQFALIWWLATQTSSPMVMDLSGLAAEHYGVARWFLIAGAVVTALSGLVMMIEQHKKRRKKNEVKTRDSGLFQSDRNR